jgi:hypothetical protein
METTYTIPGSISSETLQSNVAMIKEFVMNPLAPNGKPAKDMIKKKTKKKRVRPELDEDDSTARKRTKKTIAEHVYHTQQFVIDSDDDDDEAFFASEARLREKNVGVEVMTFMYPEQTLTLMTLCTDGTILI